MRAVSLENAVVQGRLKCGKKVTFFTWKRYLCNCKTPVCLRLDNCKIFEISVYFSNFPQLSCHWQWTPPCKQPANYQGAAVFWSFPVFTKDKQVCVDSLRSIYPMLWLSAKIIKHLNKCTNLFVCRKHQKASVNCAPLATDWLSLGCTIRT